ncbi:MAG: ChaN family lipoprotein [Nitrococcus mobilis]|nr:ChaN family lipoprotein [Nitrococcus mobilis]
MSIHSLYGAATLRSECLLLVLVLISSAVAATEPRDASAPPSVAQTPAVPLTDLPRLAQIQTQLEGRRVVFVGEFHSRLQDHRIQLEVIRHLAAQAQPLAIGVEWFQQPFQGAIDRYLEGAIDVRALLQASEYYNRWGYDFRLYAPILRFARTHGIPVIALNLPTELTRAAARQDLGALPPALRKWLPDQLDRTDADYRHRLKRIYRSHGDHDKLDFEHFYTVQLLWDEGMAQCAAHYLDMHPNSRMVILAGSGHLAYGSGIPNRLRRRTGIDGAILLPGWEGPLQAGLADYLLLPAARHLPKPGRLGLALLAKAGHLIVHSFTDNSSAQAAGLKTDDVLLAINDQPVKTINDVRAALWDHPPGDVMQVRVRRTARSGEERPITFEITLH